MLSKIFSTLALLIGILAAHSLAAQEDARRTLSSPDKRIELQVDINPQGEPVYALSCRGVEVIRPSRLGLVAQERDLSQNLSFAFSAFSSRDEVWNPVWGETAEIRDRYNEMLYALQGSDGRRINIRFRAYDDGIGFRYEIPAQGDAKTLRIRDELTEFRMTADHKAWWIPGDYDSNEHLYNTSPISGMDVSRYMQEQNILTQHIVHPNDVQTPVAMRMDNGFHLAIAEAALADFGALHLRAFPGEHRFKANLIPSPDPDIKSVNQLPFNTPWRAIICAQNAAGLLESKLVLNLNDPCAIDDVSWIKPQKYVGVWWEMHVGVGSWDYYEKAPEPGQPLPRPHGRHAANTENVKRYIDFAAKYGFDGVLVEGWNEGWENWFNQMKDEVFDFTKPYPDYDVELLSHYAAEKGVRIIMHHETSSAVESYERQMDDAYAFMRRYGMNAVKTGYVGKIIPRGEWHDGQWMVNHYLRVAERCAQNQIMVNMHEPVRPSGQHRTWPNWLACEAARGQEFNAWSRGNPPEHECILPFTRLLGGPMDYTPGVFEVRMSAYDPNKTEIVHTTVAKQLALYVTLYSPLQMACDLPQNYEKRLDVFQFIRDVPVDWDDTRILNAEIGQHLSIARRQKGSDDWYLGAITNEKARQFTFALDFLEPGKKYVAEIYADGKGAHWKDNPYPVAISKRAVRKGGKLKVKLAPGGGCAIAIKRV